MARTYGSYSSVASGRTLLNPLLVAHCELYLSSVLGMSGYANGASVTSWPDQTANARDAGPAGGSYTNPTYSTAPADLTPNGKPVVKWAGLISALASASFTWPLLGTRGYTFYWYGLTQAKTVPPYGFEDQIAFDKTTTQRPAFVLRSDSGLGGKYGLVDDAGGGGAKGFGTHASIVDQWHLHTLVLPLPNNNTVPCRYYLDGVLQTQTGGAANYQCSVGGADSYIIGNNGSTNTALKGRQGFYLWYSDTHNQATIDSFANWADVFWGL